jgi:hypothetical protein
MNQEQFTASWDQRQGYEEEQPAPSWFKDTRP